MEKSSLIAIGKVTGVHGLGGNLKVISFSDSLEPFQKGSRVALESPPEQRDQTWNTDESEQWYHIQKASPYKKGILLVLEGVDNRNKAEALIKKEIFIKKDDLPELEEDTFYWQDLLGLEVIDRTRGSLGIIDHIFPTGANDVLVVKRGDVETLVPVIPAVILSVDIPNNQMEIDLPEGL
ncbi:MAG: 16S rRNA processing protein RimM [Desulfobacteraceae bacterium]|nr:MAG: 16S rRNA processing protein RimM [Desulfobacteraceae bacterium]